MNWNSDVHTSANACTRRTFRISLRSQFENGSMYSTQGRGEVIFCQKSCQKASGPCRALVPELDFSKSAFKISGLTFVTVYIFQVQAIGPNNRSDRSNSVTI